jgi:hypothetical protein
MNGFPVLYGTTKPLLEISTFFSRTTKMRKCGLEAFGGRKIPESDVKVVN